MRGKSSIILALFFFGVPTLSFIIGHYMFISITNYGEYNFGEYNIITSPFLFASLILLGIGYYLKNERSHFILFSAWMLFSFYWALQPEYLYYKEEADIVNAVFDIVGVYFLSYVGYHEYLSYKRNEEIRSLRWLAGSSFFAGMIYFIFQKITFLGGWLIHVVAQQSVWLLTIFGYNVRAGNVVYGVYPSVPVYFNNHESVRLILACTGLQSIAVFVGIILALKADNKKRAKAFIISVPVIYVLNLIRNAGVIYGVEELGYSFYFMHNVIGKIGSLIALIVIAYFIFELLPEIYENIVELVSLYKRNGPIERIFMRKR